MSISQLRRRTTTGETATESHLDSEMQHSHGPAERDVIASQVEAAVQHRLDLKRRFFPGAHKTMLLKELFTELTRTVGLGIIAGSLVFRSQEGEDAQSSQTQMATAFMIAPICASVFSDSVFNIGRKASLLFFPFLVTPGNKRSAEYRRKFEEKKALYSPSMQEFLEQSITQYTYYLEYHNYPAKEMAIAIEEVLRLPLHPNPLKRQNPKVRETLKNFPTAVKREMAQVVSEICSHSYQKSPAKRITPVMLVGPPGTGKTFLVRQLAEALDLPLCEIKIAEYKAIAGNDMWSNAPEKGVVIDALLKSSLEHPEKPPANAILFIDELDKVLHKGKDGSFTHPSGNEVNTFLHSLLETGTTEYPIRRYGGASHPIGHIIVMLAVNHSFSDVLGDDAAEALESRIRTVDFREGFDITKKKAIVTQFIEDANRRIGRDLILPEDETIEKILQKDEEVKLKGVRILREVVLQYVQSIDNKDDIDFYLDGEEPLPFDVDKAYAKYLPKKKKVQSSNWTAF